MSTILIESTVGELVKAAPNRARVFEAWRIDYCCGGKLSLAEACARRQVEPAQIITQLQELDARDAAADAAVPDVRALSLSALADHIEQTHHVYLREELPRLDVMTEKVARVHGAREPRLTELREAFVALRDELLSHLVKEEQILFPLIRALEAPAVAALHHHCGSIANPIARMELEHDHAGQALETMHDATDGYAPPAWACNTYRAMLDGLARLEADLHQHVHKENNLLFPQALALETALARLPA